LGQFRKRGDYGRCGVRARRKGSGFPFRTAGEFCGLDARNDPLGGRRWPPPVSGALAVFRAPAEWCLDTTPGGRAPPLVLSLLHRRHDVGCARRCVMSRPTAGLRFDQWWLQTQKSLVIFARRTERLRAIARRSEGTGVGGSGYEAAGRRLPPRRDASLPEPRTE